MRYILMTKILPLASLLALAGCATVKQGVDRDVHFKSEPEGAVAQTSLGENCTTPCKLTIGSKQEFSVTFSLAGYKSQTVEVKSEAGGTGAAIYVGAAVLGGIGGIAGTAASGAAQWHVPNPVIVTLERDKPVGPASRNNRRQPPKAAPAPKPVEPAPEG